jgi:hypothetical protein
MSKNLSNIKKTGGVSAPVVGLGLGDDLASITGICRQPASMSVNSSEELY